MKFLSFHPSSLPRFLNKVPEKALPFIVLIGSHSLVLTANLISMHFCYLLQITDKQDGSKDRPMWQLSCYQLLGIVWSINHYTLSKHPVFYPPSCPCHTVHQIFNWIRKYYGSHDSLAEVQENDSATLLLSPVSVILTWKVLDLLYAEQIHADCSQLCSSLCAQTHIWNLLHDFLRTKVRLVAGL